jgi:O-antigen ligase
VVATWSVWAWRGGGTLPRSWAGLGIFLVLLLALGVALARPPRWHLTRLRAGTLALLGAFVCFGFLSILWADFRGDALTGAGMTLVYAVCFTAFCLWPFTPRAANAVLALLVAGFSIMAIISLLRPVLAENPGRYFEEGRLLGTIDYANADAALWTLAFFPAVHLGSMRPAHPVARATALAAATLLLAVSVLAQSRGWLFLLPVGIAVFVALARERLRTMLGLAIAAAATAATLPQLIDVYQRAGAERESAIDRAAVFVLVACLVTSGVGALWGALDRRIEVPVSARRALGGAAVALAVVALGAGALAASQAVDDPRSWIEAKWNDFTRGFEVNEGEQSSRFTGSLGTNRYQIWKVAWNEFRDHPVVGIGADNFAAPYLEQRPATFSGEPRYPHSIPLRLLSQLGVIGTVLFTSAVGCAVALAVRRRNRLPPTGGGTVAAALTVFGYWLLQGSVDVFWETPALAATAFGMLGLASSVEPPEAFVATGSMPPARRPGRRGAHALAAAIGVAVLAAAGVALGMPLLADAYARAGSAVWQEDLAEAYDRLDTAARLDPFSADALLIEGSLALRVGDDTQARRAFGRALEREPRNWYAYAELCLLASTRGDYATAERTIGAARRLNPKDSVLEIVERLVAARAPVDASLVNDLYRRRLNRFEAQDLINRFFQVPPFTDAGA